MATLFEKVWENHRVTALGNGEDLIYIDLHLVHEVTSPQAFEGLRLAKRRVRRADLTFATMDHNVPTQNIMQITDTVAAAQLRALERNCEEFHIPLYDLKDVRQGIVHVIGPELGLTLPGKTIVCGDSHTATHGAFGALGLGIGTSEVEHVLATQCLRLKKPKTLQVHFQGSMPKGIYAKDLILRLIGQIGTAGGTGHVIEYTGQAISELSMEGRMSICNMSIEAGARAGMIAPDEITYAYVQSGDREFAPKGKKLAEKIASWKTLTTDHPKDYDRSVTVALDHLTPQITWGTTPGMVTNINSTVPEPAANPLINEEDAKRALAYMGLTPGTALQDIAIDVVFLGSCTNSRIEDLREAARILSGKHVAKNVQVLVVPGSKSVRKQAEQEGLDKIFLDAGCEWREPGCSMCLGMNPDQLQPKMRCVATSNRNFEGRQGKDGRTHLASPATAAASAIRGKITDPREFL